MIASAQPPWSRSETTRSAAVFTCPAALPMATPRPAARSISISLSASPTAMLKTVTFRKDVMERGASGGFTNATDCADYLVKKGVAFRDAHKVVGELVAHCLNENKALLDLTLEELKQFHPAFEQDVFDDLSMIACVEKRKIPGAPAPEMVQRAIDSARNALKN